MVLRIPGDDRERPGATAEDDGADGIGGAAATILLRSGSPHSHSTKVVTE
jgi:hypothetical protein